MISFAPTGQVRALVLSLLAMASACRSEKPRLEASVNASRPPAAAPSPAAQGGPGLSPFDAPAYCRIDHRGPFLDLGTEDSHSRRSFELGPFSELESDTFSDQSYTRFETQRVHFDFWLDEPRDALQIRVRGKGGSLSSLSAAIDRHPIGSVRLRSDAFQTVAFPVTRAPLAAGRHELSLRWSGRPSADARSLGMLEWIHWAEPGQALEGYRPPRQRALWADVLLSETPRRSLSLEAPGSLRCPLQPARGTQLSVGIGFWGDGEGVARIVVRRDGAKPVVLAERRIRGGEHAGWTDLELDLAPFASELVQLELAAVKASRGGRLVFSRPEVRHRGALPAPRRARLAVLVVASGLHRELLPPFADGRQLPHLNRLVEASVRFPEYRVPTTVVAGVMASLLTGLPPLAHRVEGTAQRLPQSVLTLADRLRERSGESAFFTGAPETRAAFGFDRGFQHYEAFSPVQDIAASEPLARAKTWLEASFERDSKPARLLVLHLRGGHPPWDLSREEVAELEPRDYNGVIEARRGGLILANIRSQSRAAQRRLSAPDWARLRALSLAALAKQDRELGQLIELLERAGIWQDTLFVYSGDVAAGDPPEAPFGAARALGEDHLLVPLWIKFPGELQRGHVAHGLVTSGDVARTLAEALGTAAPGDPDLVNLERLALGYGPPLGRGHLAMTGDGYSMRWGRWLLRGKSPAAPTLCELSVDPACAHDVLGQSPLAAEALWRATYEEHRRQAELEGRARTTDPAVIDRDTAAALEVWGN